MTYSQCHSIVYAFWCQLACLGRPRKSQILTSPEESRHLSSYWQLRGSRWQKYNPIDKDGIQRTIQAWVVEGRWWIHIVRLHRWGWDRKQSLIEWLDTTYTKTRKAMLTEVECTTNGSILNSTVSEDNVHTIRAGNILVVTNLLQRIGLLSKEYAMWSKGTGGFVIPHLHVEGMSTVCEAC